MKANLFVSAYAEPHAGRAAELAECLARNAANPLLNVYALNEAPGAAILPQGVVSIDYTGKRATYADFFAEANRVGGKVSIIANSDIYFNQVISFF